MRESVVFLVALLLCIASASSSELIESDIREGKQENFIADLADTERYNHRISTSKVPYLNKIAEAERATPLEVGHLEKRAPLPLPGGSCTKTGVETGAAASGSGSGGERPPQRPRHKLPGAGDHLTDRINSSVAVEKQLKAMRVRLRELDLLRRNENITNDQLEERKGLITEIAELTKERDAMVPKNPRGF
ncbi:hypothetical protein CBS101457_003310 [Exobasidium rhododendri]|nr:hypothetical protein CBS101457_003310 [Exobasidium rhododendri]